MRAFSGWLVVCAVLAGCSGERSDSLDGDEGPDQGALDGGEGGGDMGIDGGATPDGGNVDEGPDASGDGDGDGGLPGDDGGLPDGGTGLSDGGPDNDDASVPPGDPPVGEGLTVTVQRGGVPLTGLRVLLHDASGALLAQPTTDAEGRVVRATAPSSVTLWPGFPSSLQDPVTYYGVEAGDRLVVALPAFAPDSPVGAYSVTHVAPVDNAQYYDLTAGYNCTGLVNDVSVAATIEMDAVCLTSGNDVLSVARDPDGFAIACAFAKDNAAPTSGGTVNVALGAAVAPSATHLSAANVPGDMTVFGLLEMIAHDAPVSPLSSDDGALGTTGIDYEICPGFASAMQISGIASTSALPRFDTGIVQRVPESANLTIDFADVLPRVTAAELDRTDTVRPTLNVTTAASLASADAGLWLWGWSESDGEVTHFRPWLLVTPPGLTSVRIPETPFGVATPDDANAASISFVDIDGVADYTAFKKQPLVPAFDSEDLSLYDTGVQLSLTGASGRIRFTTLVAD